MDSCLDFGSVSLLLVAERAANYPIGDTFCGATAACISKHFVSMVLKNEWNTVILPLFFFICSQ